MSDKLHCVCLFGFGLCVWQCCSVVLYSVISIVNAPHTHGIVPMFQPEETAGSFFMFPAHKAATTSIQTLHQWQNTQSLSLLCYLAFIEKVFGRSLCAFVMCYVRCLLVHVWWRGRLPCIVSHWFFCHFDM